MPDKPKPYHAIVVGGGPAGLSAALWLARYRLRVRLFDRDDPRNKPAWAVHGYLGLNHVAPEELRRIGREQAEGAGAELSPGTVERVKAEGGVFRVRLDDGREFSCRRLLIATGLRDIIPEIPGLLDFYGSSVWHCPDCDGPGVEGMRVGVIGWGRQIAGFCMEMLTWTDRLTLLTHGHEPELPERAANALERFRIPVDTRVISRLEGTGDCLERVAFADGRSQELDACFFHIAYGPGSPLPTQLGCKADQDGILKVNREHRTSCPGVYAAGDITPGSKLAMRAAADGVRAAIGIYRSLLPRERRV
ncbi:MAG: NAD(P)/FAD-dependent oxidoreductase [Longimicrobiaceae bacterium]